MCVCVCVCVCGKGGGGVGGAFLLYREFLSEYSRKSEVSPRCTKSSQRKCIYALYITLATSVCVFGEE